MGSEVDSVNAYVQWNWSISRTMGLNVQVGPTYIRIEEDSAPTSFLYPIPFASATYDGGPAVIVNDLVGPPACPQAPNGNQYIPSGGCGAVVTNPPITQADQPAAYDQIVNQTPMPLTNIGSVDRTDETVDVFAQVKLIQNWTPQLSSSVAYRRRQGAASGLGGTVIVDSVDLSLDWRFQERWRLSANGAWVNRESVSDVPEYFRLAEAAGLGIPGVVVAAYTGQQLVAETSRQRVETEMWSVSSRLGYQLFRKTHVFAQVSYTDQDSKAGTLGFGSDYRDWLAFLGVRHEFEPIGLW